MELIYTDSSWNDVGVLSGAECDFAWGSDENDFTIELDSRQPARLETGCLVYAEGSELGGRVTKPGASTGSHKLTYGGRTWHGILDDQVLCPDDGEDYLTVSGEANGVLSRLVSRMGLTSLFSASEADSGITVSHRFDRFTTGYAGIAKMLRASGAKLVIAWNGSRAVMSAEKAADYSSGDEFNGDLVDVDMESDKLPVNHLICLGSGELRDRVRCDFFADSSGKVSEKQTLFGADHRSAVYDYSSASIDQLREDGPKKLAELQEADTVKLGLPSPTRSYDVGDIVGAEDVATGLVASATITKKVVKVSSSGRVSASYEVGGDAKAAASSMSGGGGGESAARYVAGDGIRISGMTISADVTQSELDAMSSSAASSYAHSLSASMTATTAAVSAQSGSGSTLSSATVPAATATAAGVMTAADKAKLDGIAAGANKYALPVATSSTIGGVKVGSNLTASSGTLSVTKANVVGALGYTPGNFTVEQGTNSNGSWFKFSSGLLICTKTVTFSTSCTSEWASMFETPKLSLGAPAASFKSTPVISVSNVTENAGFIENVRDASASSLGAIYVARPNSVSSVRYTVHVTAIGAWK